MTDHPLESVTEIAMACGFSSPSVFSRAFRERFSVSASEWRSGRGRDLDGMPAGRKGSKVAGMIGKESGTARNALGTPGQENPGAGEYIPFITIDERRLPHVQAQLHCGSERPSRTPCRIRAPHRSLQRDGRSVREARPLAGPRGFYSVPDAKTLAVYHDSPEVTDPDKLRSSACVTVPAGTEISNGISLHGHSGREIRRRAFRDHHGSVRRGLGSSHGRVVSLIRLAARRQDVLRTLRQTIRRPHPEHKFILDICEPVRPL